MSIHVTFICFTNIMNINKYKCGEKNIALINKLDNTASVTYGGNSINSNSVTTVLLLAPTLLKAVDKLTANIGDTLTYTITVTNVSLNPITNLPFTDAVPPGASFVTGSFKVNGAEATPTLTSNILTYTIPTVAGVGTTTIQFQVKVTGGAS